MNMLQYHPPDDEIKRFRWRRCVFERSSMHAMSKACGSTCCVRRNLNALYLPSVRRHPVQKSARRAADLQQATHWHRRKTHLIELDQTSDSALKFWKTLFARCCRSL